ncbi:tRNA-dihydrouridine synthase family protein [bacterium]|nr:tRNA-dihydrouridine synthase family protein [bacterium]
MTNSCSVSETAALKAADPRLFLAPMAGLTDAPFRCLCRVLGGLSGAFVPMIGAAAILNASSRRRSLQLIDWLPGERRSVQLFGGSVGDMRAACTMLLDLGAEDININLGCQAPKIVKNGGGAIWLRHIDGALDLLEKCAETVDGRAELSVKLRLGWDRFNILPLAERLREAGFAAAFVHGRLGVQAFGGEVDKAALREVVRRSSVPVYANGDINGFEQAAAMLRDTGCRGLMIGRGALGRPDIFADLRKRFRAEESSGAEKAAEAQNQAEGLKFAVMHIELAEKLMRRDDSELAAVRRLRRHLQYYRLLSPYAARAETFSQLKEAARRLISENCPS